MIEDQVLRIVEPYLTNVTRRSHTEIIAVCPFHRHSDGSPERNPSFTLSLTKGVYRCYSCNEAGFLIKFLRILAGRSDESIRQEYERLLKSLWSGHSPSQDQRTFVDAIFDNRAIPETLLGLLYYCPKSLLAEGFEMDTLQHFEVGFDEKHQRITFPIRDLNGSLIGISGRAIHPDQEPRYKVYVSEYRDFGLPTFKTNKGVTIWNGHELFARRHLPDKETFLVIVEGFKACMKVWQAGITNVVALLGAAMTPQQRWFLERLGYTVILMLDNNDAGWKARDQVARSLLTSLTVHVALYNREQPSDCDDDEIREAVYNSKHYVTQRIHERIKNA